MRHDQRKLDLDGVPITFESPGEVVVRVEPNGGTRFDEPQIPFDGRTYICAGQIIFPDDRAVRANFELDTSARRILIRASVWITLDGNLWYSLKESEVPAVFGIPRSFVRSWQWIPDRPLAGSPPGPYSIAWPAHE